MTRADGGTASDLSDDTFTVSTLERNAGQQVTDGQRMAVTKGAAEKFTVAKRDVNEAPEQTVDNGVKASQPVVGEGAGAPTDAKRTVNTEARNVDGNGVSTEPGTVILTSAHFNADDRDGDQNDAADIVYIITGYLDSRYHRTGGDTTENEKQGWLEKWNQAANDGAGAWVRINPVAAPTIATLPTTGRGAGETYNGFTQADVNAGLIRYVHGGDDTDRDASADYSNDGLANGFDGIGRFTYRLRDNTANEPGTPINEAETREIGPEQTATVTVTNVNDAPFVDNAHNTDGNPTVKKGAGQPNGVAADAYTFTEATPQTPANISTSSKTGGIILTNDMFGIVDVDNAPADVHVTLWSTPAGNTDTATAFVESNGQVRIDGVVAGVIQLQKTGDDPSTTATEPGSHTYWVGTNSFTLADLLANKVRFLHDVKHEGGQIDLRIKALSNAAAAADRDQRNADTKLYSLSDADALVRLIVTNNVDDHPVPLSRASNDAQQGSPAADQSGVPQGEVRPVKTNTDEVTIVEKATAVRTQPLAPSMLGYEDYDSSDANADILYTITDIANLSVSGVEHVRIQKNVDGAWATLRGGNWQVFNESSNRWENAGAGGNTFTLADLDAGRVRIEHMGPEPTGDRGEPYTVTSGAHTTPARTFTVKITPINDTPTATAQSTTRVGTDAVAGNAVVRITTTDEESKNPVLQDGNNAFSSVTTAGQFTYEFVDASNTGGQAGADYSDNAYFTIDDNGLVSFKDAKHFVRRANS